MDSVKTPVQLLSFFKLEEQVYKIKYNYQLGNVGWERPRDKLFRPGSLKCIHRNKKRESETQNERSLGCELWSEVVRVPVLSLGTWKLWLIGLCED